MKKIIWIAIAIIMTTNNTYAGYTTVDCNSNTKFWEYNCNQCFSWWDIKVGDVLSFLDDVLKNDTTNDKLLYKEEQVMPVMNPINWANFLKEPNNDTFWEYTSELEALKDEDLWGYVLPPWQEVVWLKSSLWAWYKFDKTQTSWNEAWILVFDILSHDIVWSWSITDELKAHKECVLYTSTPIEPPSPVVEEPTPEPKEMTKVETWPEHIVLILLAMLIWYLILNRRKIFAK